jgi:hypothetical protein
VNLYKITTSSKHSCLIGHTVYVLSLDETSACNKVKESFIIWNYGIVECAKIELLAKQTQYPEPCDYLMLVKEGGVK